MPDLLCREDHCVAGLQLNPIHKFLRRWDLRIASDAGETTLALQVASSIVAGVAHHQDQG